MVKTPEFRERSQADPVAHRAFRLVVVWGGVSRLVVVILNSLNRKPIACVLARFRFFFVFEVLRGPLLESLYEDRWYNDEDHGEGESFYVDYDSLRLGLVRIRQLRMPNNSCIVPKDFSSQIKTCYGNYIMGSEDTEPFGPNNSTA